MTNIEGIELPDEYVREHWTYKQTPKTIVNEAKQKCGLTIEYKQQPGPLGGPFLFQLVVSLPPFISTYQPKNPSKKKTDAEQNAALQFVLKPPQWLKDILNDKIPEELKTLDPVRYHQLHGTDPPPTSKPVEIEEVKEQTKEEIERDIEKLVEELNNPIDCFGDIPQMPDIPEDHESIETETPKFSFEVFFQEYEKDPSRFLDVHGDKSLLIMVLNKGTAYPPTNSIVSIRFAGKRKSDGRIFENIFPSTSKPYEFKQYAGDALPCIDLPTCTMKLDQDILVFTTYVHAYGEIGHPPLFPPKESLLFYIRLINAKPYSQTIEEVEEEKMRTPQQKIAMARFNKEQGNEFYKRKLFKLAYDQYWHALRTIKYKEEKLNELEESLRKEIKQIQCNLYRNVAAYYIDHMSNWDEAISFCNKALAINPSCVPSLVRRSRAYSEIEKFNEAKNGILLAQNLDKDSTEHAAIQKAIKRLKEKNDDYKKRKKVMEEMMGKGIVEN